MGYNDLIMPPAFLPTKLELPAVRPGLVPRPRMLQQLNTGLGGKLTLISASTGFGKTTLVSEWLRQCGRPVAWLALDELDNDPLRFLSYLVRAIQTVQPGFGSDLVETLSTANPQDFDPVAIHFLEMLAAEIAAISTPLLLALDDYHVITRPSIQAVPQFLLNHQPANLHLVLVSRTDPPWRLGRLRACREVNEIRTADLRFTPQEAANFLNTCMGLGLTEQAINTLEARTEGWIAGLQLAALSLQGQPNPPEIIAGLVGSHRFIADYLIQEVLEKQTPDVQDFLLKTSVLEQLNAGLCDAVTERSNSQTTLLQLEQSNLFLLPLDQERNWYRYHHLFADLLRIKLGQAHPGLTAELQRRATAWYSRQGRRLDALHYALEAGDIPMADRLLAGNVFLLFNHDEVGAVFRKLEAIPISMLGDKPWLGIACANLLEHSQAQKSCQILETAAAYIERMPENAEKSRLRGHLESAWASMYGSQGDVANTVYHAQRAETWLLPKEVEMRATNLAQWGDILSKDGYNPDAMPILEHALELALQADRPHSVVMVAAALAMGHMSAGCLRDAHRVCQQALVIADDYQNRTQQDILPAAMLYAILARIYIEWDEMEKSSQFGFKGLALSERLGQPGAEVMCREYLGHTLMFQDDPTQGLQVYRRALELAAYISPWVEQMVVSLIMDGLLDREALDEAAVTDYLRVYAKTQTKYPLILQARLLLKTGRPADALEVLDKALSGMSETVAELTVRPHVFRALALQALGQESAALAALTHALSLSEPENRMMTFLREGRAMEKLLHLANRKSICPNFTRRLLAAFAGRAHPGEAHSAEGLSEPWKACLPFLVISPPSNLTPVGAIRPAVVKRRLWTMSRANWANSPP